MRRDRPDHGARLATGRWRVEPTASTVSFTARELGMIRVSGGFALVEGWVDVDEHGTPVAAEGSLDAASVDSQNARRDRDLRTPRFLDVQAYPVIRFTGSEIGEVEGGWTMAGTLEVKGRQLPLTWSVRADVLGGGVSASTELDREAAGIRVPSWLIQRGVLVRLSALFTPPTP